MSKLEDLIFSHSEIASYGQASVDITTVPGGRVVGSMRTSPYSRANQIYFITGWRASGVTTSTVNISFGGVRGWDGIPVTLVTANMGRDNKCYPYIIMKGTDVTFTINDSSTGAAQTLSLVFDYFTIPDSPMIFNRLKEYVDLCFKV